MSSVHCVRPTGDPRYQTQKMKAHGRFTDVHDEAGQIMVAAANVEGVKRLQAPDHQQLQHA